jgi:hypothetical protein
LHGCRILWKEIHEVIFFNIQLQRQCKLKL